MEYNFHNTGLNAGAPVQTVAMTIPQILWLLDNSPRGTAEYLVLVKIAKNLGLQEPAGLNGFGSWLSRNISSATRDVGRVVGQVVKIAAPIVGAVTGIPTSQIMGFVGKIGDTIGGDLGNMMSAAANGGESTQRMNERFAREDAAAQTAANQKAQAEYDAQVAAQQQINIMNAGRIRTPIGFNQNPNLPAMTLPTFTAPRFTATQQQVNTIADIKQLPVQEVSNQLARNKDDKKGFEITMPMALLGAVAVGGVVYAIAKK